MTGVDDKGEEKTLADGGILPEGGVGGGDGFLLELESLSDHQDFVLDVLLGVTDSAERFAGAVELVLFDVPTRSLWDEEDLGEDEDGDEHLEYDDHAPV